MVSSTVLLTLLRGVLLLVLLTGYIVCLRQSMPSTPCNESEGLDEPSHSGSDLSARCLHRISVDCHGLAEVHCPWPWFEPILSQPEHVQQASSVASSGNAEQKICN